MKLLKVLLAGVVMTTVLFGSANADNFERKLKKHPGYVNFENIFDSVHEDAKVEVYLKEPMLKLVAKFLKNEDEDMFDIMNKLMLVRVLVYDVDSSVSDELSDISSSTAKKLDGEGWERIVRVREDGDHVDVYLKPSEDFAWVNGIAVMVVGEDDEAVFVNIVGEINPEDISKLGGHFDIDELDDINYKKDRKNSGGGGR